MKITYNVLRYVKIGLQRVKGSVGFVRNVFKKKSCGASPVNGETILNVYSNLNWNQKFLCGYFAGTIIITIFRVLL